MGQYNPLFIMKYFVLSVKIVKLMVLVTETLRTNGEGILQNKIKIQDMNF